MRSPRTVAAAARGWTTRQLAWSCIGSFALGALALYVAGFYGVGHWQTGAEVRKQLAVAACVQKFLLQPDRGVSYAELRDASSPRQRHQLIREHKWTNDGEVAELCEDRILGLDPAHFEIPETADSEARQAA